MEKGEEEEEEEEVVEEEGLVFGGEGVVEALDGMVVVGEEKGDHHHRNQADTLGSVITVRLMGRSCGSSFSSFSWSSCWSTDAHLSCSSRFTSVGTLVVPVVAVGRGGDLSPFSTSTLASRPHLKPHHPRRDRRRGREGSSSSTVLVRVRVWTPVEVEVSCAASISTITSVSHSFSPVSHSPFTFSLPAPASAYDPAVVPVADAAGTCVSDGIRPTSGILEVSVGLSLDDKGGAGLLSSGSIGAVALVEPPDIPS